MKRQILTVLSTTLAYGVIAISLLSTVPANPISGVAIIIACIAGNGFTSLILLACGDLEGIDEPDEGTSLAVANITEEPVVIAESAGKQSDRPFDFEKPYGVSKEEIQQMNDDFFRDIKRIFDKSSNH